MIMDENGLEKIFTQLNQIETTIENFHKEQIQNNQNNFVHQRAHDLAVESIHFFAYTDKNAYKEIKTKEHLYQVYQELYADFLQKLLTENDQ